MSGKIRLDLLLVKKRLVASRSRAGDLVRRGFIKLDGQVVTKPGLAVSPDVSLAVDDEACPYVSRAGLKLAQAIRSFELDATDRVALDLGASTGGFTQVLLENGARHVYAVDVGREQLHDVVRFDPRVTSLEGQNVRHLTGHIFKQPINAISADLSFISLTKALPAPLKLAVPGCWLIALVKPQFEVGPAQVGKGGIVKDKVAVERAVHSVFRWVGAQPGWQTLGLIDSPIKGQHGNSEFLLAASYTPDA